MCVGLPGRVTEINDGSLTVNVSGAEREVSAELLEKIAVGDYVMIHAGIAIARITAEEAEETQDILGELYGLER
jgi:hydrogenase expression/formation protein HypC